MGFLRCLLSTASRFGEGFSDVYFLRYRGLMRFLRCLLSTASWLSKISKMSTLYISCFGEVSKMSTFNSFVVSSGVFRPLCMLQRVQNG